MNAFKMKSNFFFFFFFFCGVDGGFEVLLVYVQERWEGKINENKLLLGFLMQAT